MKKFFAVMAMVAIATLFSVSRVAAGEGSLELTSAGVACEGVSVWQGSSYRLTGRCQGLVYPFETQYEHYVMWAQLANGNTIRVDDIDRGYFDGNVASDFGKVLITAEGSSSPRRPSDKLIVSGTAQAFDFSNARKVEAQVTPAPAPNTNGTMTVQDSAKNTATADTANVGSVVGNIFKSLLVIVGVIIVLTVGASLIFRRRGSVSA